MNQIRWKSLIGFRLKSGRERAVAGKRKGITKMYNFVSAGWQPPDRTTEFKVIISRSQSESKSDLVQSIGNNNDKFLPAFRRPSVSIRLCFGVIAHRRTGRTMAEPLTE